MPHIVEGCRTRGSHVVPETDSPGVKPLPLLLASRMAEAMEAQAVGTQLRESALRIPSRCSDVRLLSTKFLWLGSLRVIKARNLSNEFSHQRNFCPSIRTPPVRHVSTDAVACFRSHYKPQTLTETARASISLHDALITVSIVIVMACCCCMLLLHGIM